MKKYFISGIAFLLPIAITLAIVKFVLQVLTNPFQSLFTAILSLLNLQDTTWVANLSSLFILFSLVGFTLLVGIFVTWLVSRQMIRFSEKLVARIPLVNKIYHASKEVIQTLVTSPTSSFKQVVVVPFPSAHSYCLGFLVKENPLPGVPHTQELISVFIPTTPNPTTGFILLFHREKVRPIQISVEEAFKYILSCGMIAPSWQEPVGAPHYFHEHLADTAPSHLPAQDF